VVRFSEADKKTIWEMREAGVPVKRIARHLGRRNSSLRKFIADAGGRRPSARQRCELRLSLAEREEISRGLAAGMSLRAIACGMSRAASTICREVSGVAGRSPSATARIATQASETCVVSAAAQRRGTQARRLVVSATDCAVVG
jgi:IS30 family transposase